MKIKLKLLLFMFIGCIVSQSLFAQEQQTSNEYIVVLKRFVQRLHDPNLATDIMLSQDLITSKKLDEDLQEYLLASIDEIRINVQSKDINQLEYLSFAQAGRKETSDIDLEGIDPQQVYFVKYLKRFVFAAVIRERKIASFTLVSKGNNKAHFVFY
ncbi:hypothetical protein HS960_16690 [Sphingobacterium paramultivorum]|uniref:DUF3887 domain-containing protein n=1 Tax=Sphingobacterium paramultivorum TaxID=2886510 RepID=A0A7G5E5B7_9SPHI|nr:hypothetical protein [Sphingobacterium paramultivorum]QMV69192.1 hypothetical protein HS960_16690 [Sphingobacterium paramultivorum]WSO12982.1 hypothetical protein VUL84_16690 [Sphingobacterium paramultivorum]